MSSVKDTTGLAAGHRLVRLPQTPSDLLFEGLRFVTPSAAQLGRVSSRVLSHICKEEANGY